MSEDSGGSTLRERLRAQIEADRKAIQEVVADELGRLEDGLKQRARHALSTVETDIRLRAEGSARRLKGAVRWPWMIRPLLIGLAMFAGVMAGSWGLTRWLAEDIRAKIERRTFLDAQIAEQAETLRQIEEGTWGVVFHEEEGGRFLILPEGAGYDPEARWTVGGKVAVKLEPR